MSRPRVFFDITMGGKAAGRIVMEVSLFVCHFVVILFLYIIILFSCLFAVVQRHCTEDKREFPRVVHRREGYGQTRQTVALQGQQIPSHHSEFHVSGACVCFSFVTSAHLMSRVFVVLLNG
jgi:hypothetical protein